MKRNNEMTIVFKELIDLRGQYLLQADRFLHEYPEMGEIVKDVNKFRSQMRQEERLRREED